jgi:hypothetical protein
MVSAILVIHRPKASVLTTVGRVTATADRVGRCRDRASTIAWVADLARKLAGAMRIAAA